MEENRLVFLMWHLITSGKWMIQILRFNTGKGLQKVWSPIYFKKQRHANVAWDAWSSPITPISKETERGVLVQWVVRNREIKWETPERSYIRSKGRKIKQRALHVKDKHSLEKVGKKERKYWNVSSVRASMLYIPSWAGKHGRRRRKRDAFVRHDIHNIFKGLFSCCLSLTWGNSPWGKSCKPQAGLLPASYWSCLLEEISRVLLLLWCHSDCDGGGRGISLGGASWVFSHLNHSWLPAHEQPSPSWYKYICGERLPPLRRQLREGRLKFALPSAKVRQLFPSCGLPGNTGAW